MFLQQDHLTIRNAGAEDAPQLAEWWNDGKVMAHAGFPRGLGTTAEKIAGDLKSDSDDARRRLMLELDGRPIGEMSYSRLEEDTAEIGIKICDFSCQDRGLGKRYLSLLIGALFQRGCRRIVLDTNLNNRRAQHVYEQLGFRKIRVRENSWQDQLGQWQSAVDYQLFPEDFRPWNGISARSE